MPSEFELIARYFKRSASCAILGPGDDCALLSPSQGMALAVTTDMLISGVHFFPDTDPWQLGWKALAVNLSDLAAMGAQPRWALLAASLPCANETWISSFSAGLFACAHQYGVDLIGGDTTRGPMNLCITAAGELPVDQALCRGKAKAGDDVWISGQTGLAGLGLAHLQNRTQLFEPLLSRCLLALHKPIPRIELGLALQRHQLARAAIDISDGLLADIGHIAVCSSIDVEIFLANLPPLPDECEPALARICQLSGGDDYELAFCAPPSKRLYLIELAESLQLPLWRIGNTVTKKEVHKSEVRLIGEDGRPVPITQKGFDHFA